LKDTPGWSRAQVEEAMRAGNRLDVKVAQAVPVHWVYVTAWADPGNGSVQFRDDIYGRDGLGIGAVAQAGRVQAPAPDAATDED
jgi:murein L,D-transpeptidase YcbB/YkuD